jgi:hypothetical protein
MQNLLFQTLYLDSSPAFPLLLNDTTVYIVATPGSQKKKRKEKKTKQNKNRGCFKSPERDNGLVWDGIKGDWE